MARNVIEIAQASSAIIGMREPVALVGSRDSDERALLALIDRAGQTMSRMRNTWSAGWTALTREHEFQTADGVEEYALPADFESLIDGTVWNRTVYREARGVLSPQQWQAAKGGLLETVSIAPLYRLRRSSTGGRAIWLDPTPSAVEDVVFEYASTHWLHAANNTGTTRRQVAADTDVSFFDDDLLEMSLIWRFKQSRGLSWAVEIAEYESEVARRMAADAGSRSITLGRGGRRGNRLNWPENITA